MPGTPQLITVARPDHPAGAVLLLHGGGSRRDSAAVSPTQLSVLRMIPVARRVRRAGRGRLAVYRLLNSVRGWDTTRTPVDDAAWALDQVRADLPDVPVALVGHSLGGRAALLSGGREGVRAVVALNPYVFPDDAPDLRGRQVLFVHGDEDRIASPAKAEAVARRLMGSTEVGFVTVTGGKHAMLTHGATFERAAADFVAATLLGDGDGDGGGRRGVGGPAGQVLDGDAWVTV